MNPTVAKSGTDELPSGKQNWHGWAYHNRIVFVINPEVLFDALL
jgi:hypothetical protein